MSKKLVIPAILLAFFILPAYSAEVEEVTLNEAEIPVTIDKADTSAVTVLPSEVPKWEEFCESGYENAQVKDKKNILNVINFVDAERTKSNYWAERRVNFEKSINHCNTLADDKRAYCYEGVRRSEKERNQIYEQQRKQYYVRRHFGPELGQDR